MEVPVYERQQVIDRAKDLMKEYEYDAYTAICQAEQEIEKQIKKEWGEYNE